MNNVNYVMYMYSLDSASTPRSNCMKVPYNQWRRPLIDAAEEGGGAEGEAAPPGKPRKVENMDFAPAH